MQRFFGHIEALDDIGEVLLYSSEVCADYGAIRRSYHLTPQFEPAISSGTTIFAHGFSDEWLKRYEDPAFRAADPIPDRVIRHGAMLTWQEARTQWPNTPENEAYFKAMDEEGLIHGIGLPLFGPRGRDAYASIDFGKPISEVSDEQLGVIRSIPQAAHQRVCVLLDAMTDRPELSEREREVMHWVVQGKSYSAIAGILDLSPDTVKTYAKRIYSKLHASDRVGATVAALKQGLVWL